jgi:hypothetical protein
MSTSSTARNALRLLRIFVVLGMVLGLLTPLFQAPPSYAASATGASFSGGTGTVTVNGTVYAKNGGALTLTVTTDNTTKCVRVTDGITTVDKNSGSAQTSWTFTSADSAALFTAGSGNGMKSVTATAFRSFNGQNKCTANAGETAGPQTASYVLDNTGPVVTGAIAPAANAAGWNKSDVTITWSATDAGSGVNGVPSPATDSVTADTAGVTKTATAIDRLGNSATGSVTVKLDQTAPTITGSRSPAANSNGWNNSDVTVSFTCSDPLSGIAASPNDCPNPTTLTTSGANQSATGSVKDNAGNSTSATVSGINIDKVAPTLSGAPTTSPNGAGWYNSDVTVAWTCNDALSGIDGACPANSMITGDGTGLTANASVSDKAGNTTSATSNPAVKIDKTVPNTTATAPTTWNNIDVTVNLNAADALSGVAGTFYKLDGGAQQSGSSITIHADGIHTLQFWSVDNAGNTEPTKNVQVKIDQTPPTINHTQSPTANGNGWNNTDVTVTFTCGDSVSGVASCTSPQTVTTEGQSQAVTGTATDNAGNTATDPAKVSIDKTPPTITAAADRVANGNGWYNDDVTISFTCGDSLSGVASCPGSQTLGEGANQSASGTATDAAGNSASAGVSQINIDKTAPSLSGAASSAPNGNGWYGGDVTVHWTASDALSGIDGAAPDDSTITGEGDNLSASASVSDLAGNSTSTTVSGIKIDRTAPSTLASVPASLASGWYAGDVLVTLTTGADLSGVDKTYYSLDGGAAQEYTAPFNHGLGGIHTITFWSVDKAGNVEDSTAPGHIITLKIDNIRPTIAGSAIPAANAAGWNNIPVTVSFDCSDAESGIASAGCTSPVTLSSETTTAGQSVPGHAEDNAGNTADTTVGPIKIDLTAPALTGAATTEPNGNGWYKGDVTIHWTGQDGLSGIDTNTQPADSPITGEGSNLGAGPVTISDKAGNVSDPTSVAGIKIDRTAPSTSSSVPGPLSSGWYAGPVQVTLNGVDSLSGLDATYYSVDGGQAQVYSGPFSHNLPGTHTITYWSVDQAGNVEDKTAPDHSITLKIDDVLPTISGSRAPAANGFGWNNGSVTVSFTCSDAESGIAACDNPVTLSNEGAGQSVTGNARDNASNMNSATVSNINIDLTKPTLNGAATTQPNGNGWYKGDVTIHWTASDALSGLDGAAPADSVIAGEGNNLGAGPFTIADKAGNVSDPASVSGIKIDRTPPTVAFVGGPSNGGSYYFGNVPAAPTCTANDELSGLAGSCVVSGFGTSVGPYTLTATATDNAGNTTTATRTYTVLAWNFGTGFYQPVDNSGTSIVWNTVRAGSTVPLKFNLYAGTTKLTDTNQIVQPLRAVGVTCSTGTSDDIELTATGGTSLRWDATAQQFIYNWKTPATIGCYKVTISAIDGSTLSAYFRLR